MTHLQQHEPVYSDRLNFRLKSFLRIAWVNDEARTTWSPRLAAIRKATTRAEWLSVALGMRSAALLVVPGDEVEDLFNQWKSYNLTWMLLDR
jgi:hypothetical protein